MENTKLNADLIKKYHQDLVYNYSQYPTKDYWDYEFKDEKYSLVPAVTHFDQTGRLQSVTKDLNPWYHNFLKLWEKETGIPILLNTSFNDREPIVETAEDAVKCFLKTNIDYLYFPEYNYLVSKDLNE